MAYGFRSINDDGEVIISDFFQNLHFIDKAARDTVDGDDDGFFDNQDNTGSERSNFFPNFTGSNGIAGASDELDGRVIITYTITTSGRPVAFIKPHVDAYDRWYALISQSEVNNDWTFEVLMSGVTADNYPELFIFVDANSIPVASLTDTHGMIVYQSDGVTKSFDSRARPLSILDAKDMGVRQYPPNDGRPVVAELFSNFQNVDCGEDTLDHDFHSNEQQNIGECTNPFDGVTEANCENMTWTPLSNDGPFGSRTITVGAGNATNLTDFMFSIPSFTQSVMSRQLHGYEDLGGGSECFSTAAWWVMYRAAYRLQPHATNTDGDKIHANAGWGTFAAGYNFSSVEADTQAEFVGTGNSWADGTQPYNSGEIINFASSTMIVADSTIYT